jgi:hypothetical protein
MAIQDLRQTFKSGTGPKDSASFLEYLADHLVIRMGDVIADRDDTFDAVEDEVLS